MKVRENEKENNSKIDRNSRKSDYFGADLRKINMKGKDLRGACQIAANMSGIDLNAADMRDANIKGANLTNSMFLTQAQVNSAKGDSLTKLPVMINRPSHWSK